VLDEIGELLREADTGIQSIRLVADSEDLQRQLDARKRNSSPGARQLADRVRMEFLHESSSDAPMALSFDELSDGTRRLVGSLGPDIILARQSTVTFIDELDRSFHTALTRHLIEHLNRTATEGQFVFTTHDTNLLDAGVFGRDAIWFVEKDRKGAAHLQSLVEFNREQLDALQGRLEQGYLQGRFGAVPVLGTPAQRRWTVR
jgi:AAA15 family ATPase/GTPase